MLKDLNTLQTGRCGELLVQFFLLKLGIESAQLTTDTGIDLVVYPRNSKNNILNKKTSTIQVKTSRPRYESENWLSWSISDKSPADYVAMVDLSRNKIWLLSISDFKKNATKSGANIRIGWSTPEWDSEREKRREKDFISYEMEKGIINAFGLDQTINSI